MLCVVQLDSLDRSLRELLEPMEMLKQRGIALLSLEECIDTTSVTGELVFPSTSARSLTSSSTA